MKLLLAKVGVVAAICLGMFAVLAAPAVAQDGYPIQAPRISVAPAAGGFDDTGGLGGDFGPDSADGAAADGDEVLGITQTPGLAVTGSTVNLPVAVAAGLIGAGSISLLVARKRRS